MKEVPSTSLRPNSLSFVESLAQTIGGIAPSGGLAIVIPLVFAKAGNATWWMFVPMLLGYVLLVAVFNIFATRRVSAGALGAYGNLAFGKWGNLLFSWTYIVTLLAGVGSGSAIVVHYADLLIHRFGGSGSSTAWYVLLLVATVVLAAGIALRGIRLSTDFMLVVECLSLGLMFWLMAWAFVREPRWMDPSQFRVSPLPETNLRVAFLLAYSSLCGFESVTALGDETRRATHTIPRAISFCIAPMSLLYIVTAYGLVLLFHRSPIPLGETDAPFEVLANMLGAPWLGTLISVGILLSFFAMILGYINASARILYDLARKNEFWRWGAKIHPRTASPSAAIFLLSGVSLLMPLLFRGAGTTLLNCVDYLTQFTSLAFVAVYVMIAVAAPVFLRRIGELKAFDGAVCVATFVILAVVAVFNIYPVPPWPLNLLPYAFVVAVAAGIGATLVFRTREAPAKSPPTVLAPPTVHPADR